MPLIEPALRALKPFRVVLREFGLFEHRGSQTIWLRPECDPPDALVQLHRVLVRVFPHLDDLDNKGSAGYTPHATVGQMRGKARGEATRKLVAQLQADWQPIEFTVDHVELLAREDDTPFGLS